MDLTPRERRRHVWLFQFLAGLLSLTSVQAFHAISTTQSAPTTTISSSSFRYSNYFQARAGRFSIPATVLKISEEDDSNLFRSEDEDEDEDGSSSSSSFDMKSLQSRMAQVQDSDSKLPIIVLDTMLPRQTLKIEVENDIFQRLVKHLMENENPNFGMVGLATLATTGETIPLQNGVEVEIVGTPKVVDGQEQNPDGTKGKALRVKLVAKRRFRIKQDELTTVPEGWTAARVEFFDASAQEETEHENKIEQQDPLSLARAIQQAAQLTKADKNLIEKWISLARKKEQFPGQVDQILKDLGPIPPPEEPSNRAFWVGALINPLPGMGVAMEIRPLLLMAQNAEERVGIVLNQIQDSIAHMDGTKPLF